MNHVGLNISHGEAAGRHSPFQLLHVSGAYLHNESQGIHLSPNETECEQCSVPDRQLCKDLMRCLHHEPYVVTRLPIPHIWAHQRWIEPFISSIPCLLLWFQFPSLFLYYLSPPLFSPFSPFLTPQLRSAWVLAARFTILSLKHIKNPMRKGPLRTSNGLFVLSASSASTPSKTLFSATVILSS